MLCKKCKKEIPDVSVFCNFCGRKQTVTAAKHRKRAHGTGTIRRDTRYKNSFIAIAPSSRSRHEQSYSHTAEYSGDKRFFQTVDS